jgi:hypothetical protein
VPVHDGTTVDAGVFHDSRREWVAAAKHALSHGILPPDYYAMADRVAGPGNPDVLGPQCVRPVKQPTGGTGPPSRPSRPSSSGTPRNSARRHAAASGSRSGT